MKFKILPKVDGFKFKGIRYLPGEIVDLPASYQGESFLQRVEPEVEPVAPPSVVEGRVEPVGVPFEASAKRKRTVKVPRIFRR